jgi:uncharacterized membrane-anchored protein
MSRFLPQDDAQRTQLYAELHARPVANIAPPALIVSIAVLNAGITRADELMHLQRLAGQAHLSLADLESNFLRLQLLEHTLKWERHSEFTRYSLAYPLPFGTDIHQNPTHLRQNLQLNHDWIASIPGTTIAAIELWMLNAGWDDHPALVEAAKPWMQDAGTQEALVLATLVGHEGHSIAACNFQLHADGYERMLVLSPAYCSVMRTGRVVQRVLEIENYRLMALRGLPVAKQLAPQLAQWETQLAGLNADLVNQSLPQEPLLADLIALAADVEKAITTHAYRFSATQAYAEIVQQRLDELHEKVVTGTQTMGGFLHRRLNPAIATVNATQRRLAELSQRIARTSALLRTRVDIATEKQNQQLLEKLTRGQQMQLRLQATVEGLSIAAVSYYAVSLLLYASKALKAAGMPVNPEILTGALIPLVIATVWFVTRRIHRSLLST